MVIHADHDKRKSGISLIGELPWGSHFCLFYQTAKERFEILVPYFRAGLENNEFCLWVTSGKSGLEDAKKALKKAVPGFEDYTKKGQLEIISYDQWSAGIRDPAKEVILRLDEAISRGFDGLRLSCDCSPENKGGKILANHASDAISKYNVIAVFEYPRDNFDAIGLMEVVKNHRFALVRNADKWDVIESSEARTVKDALKRSEEKLKSLFSNMSEGFAYHRIVLDSGGRSSDFIFLQVNRAFEELTGLKAKSIIGRRVKEVIPGIENDPTDWIGKFGKVAMTGKPMQFESYSEHLGKYYSVSAFCPHKGYFAVTFNDITGRRKAEEDLRKNRDELEAANKELESFSYSVSHDLRAPLRAIDGFSRIIIEDYADRLDSEGKRFLNIIRKNTQEMGRLIDDLLSFSRIGRQKITPSVIDIGNLAKKTFEDIMLSVNGRIVSFEVNPMPRVKADRSLIRQVVINLLSNAVKFTAKKGEAVIELGGSVEGDENIYYVRDNGAGFDMRYSDKLFGVFQRLHSAEEFEGTGVGLAIVLRIILMHGGRVWAEGKVNEGATFYFALPKNQ